MLADAVEALTDQDEVLVSQAHVVLGCDPSTIYRWLSKGRLERMETNRGVYVNVGDLRRVSAEIRTGRPRGTGPKATTSPDAPGGAGELGFEVDVHVKIPANVYKRLYGTAAKHGTTVGELASEALRRLLAV